VFPHVHTFRLGSGRPAGQRENARGKPCLRCFIPSLRYRTVNRPYNRENFLPLSGPDRLVKSRQSLPIKTHSGQDRVSRASARNGDAASLIDVKAGGHALTRNAARIRDRGSRADAHTRPRAARTHARRSCAHTRPNGRSVAGSGLLTRERVVALAFRCFRGTPSRRDQRSSRFYRERSA